jgi:hypothetical protein
MACGKRPPHVGAAAGLIRRQLPARKPPAATRAPARKDPLAQKTSSNLRIQAGGFYIPSSYPSSEVCENPVACSVAWDYNPGPAS